MFGGVNIHIPHIDKAQLGFEAHRNSRHRSPLIAFVATNDLRFGSNRMRFGKTFGYICCFG